MKASGQPSTSGADTGTPLSVSLAASVAPSYLALRSAQQRQDIAEDHLRSQQEALQMTQWREQTGLVSLLVGGSAS